MNILQICTKVPFPPKDGGAAAVYALSKTFAKLGHHVDIIAVNPSKHYVLPNQPDQLPFTIYSISVNTRVLILEAIGNLLFSRTSYHIKRFISEDFKNKLINILENKSYDIVQIEGIYLCCYLPVIRKHSNAKISLRAHNVEHLLWQDIILKETRFLFRQYLKIQLKRLKKFEVSQLGLVDVIVTISQADENAFRILNAKAKIITIQFGIDLNEEKFQTLSTINSIFYIGALDWLPNQEALIWFLEKVWPKVLDQFPSLVFHIAGRNAPKRLTEKLNKVEHVVFHGEVENSSDFMRTYDLMVVPLFSGGGMRVKIIEAMNNGKVIVASNKACEGIPVQNNRHLRMVNSIDEFVSAIEISIKQPETNVHLLEEAKSLINENFDNLVLTLKLVNFYRQELA